MTRKPHGPPRDVAIAFGTLVAIALGFAIYFMAAPVEPFGFFKDLGFNWEVLDWATHRIRSPLDAYDAIGWSPWEFGPLFFLNSYLGDLFGTIVAWIVGNAWLAVKIVEVVQTLVAGAGAYAMYASASRSRAWASIFGLLYAALPATTFTIRWNEDFGWIVALLPWCLAISRRVLCLFGARGIPLVGIVAAFAGYLIALQFFLFASVPLFALALAGERRRFGLRSALGFIPLGLACCVAVGAFYVVPTFVHPMLSDSAQRSDSLASGAFLQTFSLDWIGLLALVQREWAASPIPAFNVSASLPWLAVPSAAIWLAALAHVVRARDRERTWSDPLSIAIVVACTILALGSSLPFGSALWSVLYRVPHVDGIRTADRFFTIVPMMVLFWAISACEPLARKSHLRFRAFAYAAFTIAVVFVTIDHVEHALTLDYSKGIREPEIDAIRQVVTSRGVPVASFADVNGGASEDAPVYGRPEPISFATTDFGSRYIDDGIGASGMLGRNGVGIVVSSPNWTYDAPSRPNVANVYRLVRRAQTLFDSPENVTASAIRHRDDAATTRAVCVRGGPGAFDLLAGDPAFDSEAFDGDDEACGATGFVDYDPLDDWRARHPIDTWSGNALTTDGTPLRDADYPVLFNRTLLNVPWYRNAVDGERPVFDANGPVRIAHDTVIALAHHHAWPARSRIFIRIAAHVSGHIVVENADARPTTIEYAKGSGYRWYAMTIRNPVADSAAVDLRIDESAGSPDDETWAGIALDGIVVLPPNAPVAEPRDPQFVAASLSHLESVAENDRTIDALNARDASAVSLISEADIVARQVSGARAYVADSAFGRMHFRWNGAPGRYAIAAEGWLGDAASSIAIAPVAPRCCDVIGFGRPGSPSHAAAVRDLVRGSTFDVELAAPRFRARLGDRVTSVRIAPARPIAAESDRALTVDFRTLAESIASITSLRNVAFDSNGASGTTGSTVAVRVAVPDEPRVVFAHITSVGGSSGSARLACGASVDDRPLADETDLAVRPARGGPCSVAISWSAPGLVVQKVAFGTSGAFQPIAHMPLWIPAGRFGLRILRADGSDADPGLATIAGCAAARCTFAGAATHDVRVGAHRDDLALLVLAKTSTRPPPIAVRKTAALRWSVRVAEPTDVALTQLSDGNWVMANDIRTIAGTPCDIASTCFHDVQPGTYRIVHHWAWQLKVGVAVTLFAIVIALAFPIARRRAISA